MGGDSTRVWLFSPSMALAILAIILAGGMPCRAADHSFGYSTLVQGTYTTDVFRNGTSQISDTITSLGLKGQWEAATARSSSLVSYSPEYLNYATLDELDHFDHRFRATWGFNPGPRSATGIRGALSYIETPRGFINEDGSLGGEINQLSRQFESFLTPYWSYRINQQWSLDAEAVYRTIEYRNDELIDSTRLGIELSATSQFRPTQNIGAAITADAAEFDDKDILAPTQEERDRFLTVQAVWSGAKGRSFNWSAGTGAFRFIGGGSSSEVWPAVNLLLNWNSPAWNLTLNYDLGYSVYGGSFGSQRTQHAGLALLHRWLLRLHTYISGSYFWREPLGVADPVSQRTTGSWLNLGLRYSWTNDLGLVAEISRVRQANSNLGNPDLDYGTATIALTYAPGWKQRGVSGNFGSGVNR